MDKSSQNNSINRKTNWLCGNFGNKAICLLLMLTGLFFFASALHAEKHAVEETKVIREGPPPLENPQYLDLGTFVVNMPGDKYFLKSSIQLGFENAAAKDWLLARLPIAKDLVITHLNSITVEQFDDTKNRAVIKNDLQIRLNSLFPNKAPWEDMVPIRRILFLEFYRQ
ncbi:MAG TPA: flagellar basal body-associated FliL family protein [Deltaproteobacteria bacterium]|jgi:flagellar basal body-associated protein FliL|nr:flagellar basal body-associated FliL family protein [SAR324 cluster bacterium]MCH2265664.1 flagellar basal body-associated FliL family protein [SAR324 cluster bacterium]HIN48063.1 flagellar basal body-associated FliL family protein [Deltaproteobacteria bacterium]